MTQKAQIPRGGGSNPVTFNIKYAFPDTTGVGFIDGFTPTTVATTSSKLALPTSTKIRIDDLLADDCNYGVGYWCYYSETQSTVKCFTGSMTATDVADLSKNTNKTLYFSVAKDANECSFYNEQGAAVDWTAKWETNGYAGCRANGGAQALREWCEEL